MGWSCCVNGCTSRFSKGGKITFHQFPKEKHLRRKWIRFVNIRRQSPGSFNNNSHICSLHFNEDDYSNYMQYKLKHALYLSLKKDAVPSRYSKNITVGDCPRERRARRRQIAKKIKVEGYMKYNAEKPMNLFPNNPKLYRNWPECLIGDSHDNPNNSTFKVRRKHFCSIDVSKKGLKTFLKKNTMPIEGDEPITDPRKQKVPSQFKLKGTVAPFAEEKISQPENVNSIEYCNIPMCSNNSQQQPHLQYHIVPNEKSKDTTMSTSVLNAWNEFINKKFSSWGIHQRLLKAHKCIRICSNHFKVEDFVIPPTDNEPGTKVLLKPTAYPSVDPLLENYYAVQRELLEDTNSDVDSVESITSREVDFHLIQLVDCQVVVKSGLIPSTASKAAGSSIRNLIQAAKRQHQLRLGTFPRFPTEGRTSNGGDSQTRFLIPPDDSTSTSVAVKPDSVPELCEPKDHCKVLVSGNPTKKVSRKKRKILVAGKRQKKAKKQITSDTSGSQVSSPANATRAKKKRVWSAALLSDPTPMVRDKQFVASNSDDIMLSPLPSCDINASDAPSQSDELTPDISRCPNDETVSKKLPGIILKLRKTAVKNLLNLKQEFENHLDIVVIPATSQCDPTVSSARTDVNEVHPPMQKQIKIEENIVESSLQPFFPRTPTNELNQSQQS